MFVCLVRSCQIIDPYCTSGKLRFCDGKSPCLMDKSTISIGPCSIANCDITRGYTYLAIA